ncbi:MAG: hypothetical protein KGQ46_15135 [Hyphomicrobiales bacterium]|nr:hypothetical protein [Hyphomicrobiales bacterium]MDE2114295.1 hypothetical protein [Hyphomicrobiales bacterium]
MTAEEITSFIAEASLAPSVHNVQPARWRIEIDGATLFEDSTRRLPAADPKGDDIAISLGAAVEGFRLAASRAGYGLDIELLDSLTVDRLRPVARLRLTTGTLVDALAAFVTTRASHRGAFTVADEAERSAATALRSDDTAVLIKQSLLIEAGQQLGAASWTFMRDDKFRHELLSWMRLSRRDPRWSRDGLNAEAMAMGSIAATAASFVLGPFFLPLARIGLAKPLLAEGSRVAKDTAVVLFHRPKGEARFVSGAHFYRLWLRIEEAGFGAAVLAALADNAQANTWACVAGNIPSDHRLINAFRIGRRPAGQSILRARLPLNELLVSIVA